MNSAKTIHEMVIKYKLWVVSMLFFNNRKVQPAFTMACPCLKYYYYILGHKQVFIGTIFQTWCKCYFTPTAVRKAATELSHSMFGHAYSKRYSSDLVLLFHKAVVRDRLKKKDQNQSSRGWDMLTFSSRTVGYCLW